MLKTWLTERFELTVPVIGAPMAGPGEGPLAAAVSAAGGLGMVGVGATQDRDWIEGQAAVARATGRPFGFGLMAWAVEKRPELLEDVLGTRPALVSVSFGDFAGPVEAVREAGVAVTVQAGNVEEALRAQDAGADFVVLRGAEGGGHGRNEIGTLPLLQAALDRLRVPAVAAGGIGTGRGLAAALAAGAVGAWVGTAFLGCHEASNSAAARRRLFGAAGTDTAYGRVFDVAQRLSWPEEYGGRALRNPFLERWADRLEELATDDAAARQLGDARAGEDFDVAYLYAGQGVGLLTEERSAADVLAELATAEQHLRSAVPTG